MPGCGRWCFARASASTLMAIIALFTRNLAAPTGTPLRLALFAASWTRSPTWPCCWQWQSSLLSLAAVLMSLYPVATVALAMVVLKERVTRWQAVGIVLALLAVGMIATG